MIFVHPIILASEFVQHVTMIVLVGLVVTDCVACYRDLKTSRQGLFNVEEEARFRARKWEHLELLAVVSLSALWFIVEYFANLSLASYHLFFHVPTVLAVLWLMRRITKPYGRALLIPFSILVVFAGAHIVLDAISFILQIHLSWDPVVRATIKTAEAVALYFLVIRYMIISKEQ